VVIGSELSLNISDAGKYSGPLVVSRNEDGRPMGRRSGRHNRTGPPLVESKTARQDFGKPDAGQNCRQADDRNHDATEHGSHIPSGNSRRKLRLHERTRRFLIFLAIRQARAGLTSVR
jgi:hypothetical protein